MKGDAPRIFAPFSPVARTASIPASSANMRLDRSSTRAPLIGAQTFLSCSTAEPVRRPATRTTCSGPSDVMSIRISTIPSVSQRACRRMYTCANGGYHVDIERIYSNMPGGFVAKPGLLDEMSALLDIISAIPVDISSNLAHALRHERAVRRTHRYRTLLPPDS